jgi:hypothetical protein
VVVTYPHPSRAATESGNTYLSPRPDASPSTAIEISEIWVNPNSSNLLAKVSVTISRWGETINGCSVIRTKVGGYFVLPPGIPMVGRDGVVLKGETGKTKYSPAVVFTKDAGRRFSDAVLAVLRASHPEIFDGGGS